MPSPRTSPRTSVRTCVRTCVRAAVAALLATPLAAVAAGAQNAASASVTAEVQQPITVARAQDLVFGTVFPGVTKTIAVSDAGAAAFTVRGQQGANVHLSFSLPTSLASGGNTLPVSSWAARHNVTNAPSGGTDFTPDGSPTAAAIGGAGFLYLFLGATAQPAVAQPSGSYTGTATLTVVYF